MASNTFRNLQVLRGAAAVLVAYFHLQPMLVGPYGFEANDYIGAFGVDVFFVISGFVMYISNEHMNRPTIPFIVGRFFRIVPLYWASTLLLVLLFSAGFHPNGLNHLEPHMLLQSMFFVTSLFPDGRYDLVLSLGWTLIYELFFYFIFALTLRMRSPERSLAAVSTFFVFLVAIGMVFPDAPPRLAYFFQPIILEFLLGGLIAIAVMRWRRRNDALPAWTVPAALLATILSLIGMIVGLQSAGWITPTGNRSLVWGIPAMIIVASCVAVELRGMAIKNRYLLLLGSASYALYLFHPLAMQATVKVLVKVPALVQLGPGIAIFAALAAAAAISIVIHLTVETTFLKLGKRVVSSMKIARNHTSEENLSRRRPQEA